MRSHPVAYVVGIVLVGALSGGVAAALLTETVADALSNPRGIGLGPGGRLLVTQIDSGVLSEIRADGNNTSISAIAQFQAQNGNDRVGGPVDVAAHGLGNTFVLISGGASSPAAQLLRVQPKNGVSTELVPGTLLAPGGIVVDGSTLYVTTGTVFGPGAGSVVRIDLN